MPIDDRHPLEDLPKNSVVYAIALFIHAQAPRQNWLMAVVAALALWAGIVGRNINVSGSGLNLYLLMIAGTGRGKEGMASGIARLIEAIAKSVPIARDLLTGRYASSQALLQQLKGNPATISMQGEGEYLLRGLTSPKASQNDKELLRSLLDLYHKSGFGQTFTGYRKADLAGSVAHIHSPNFTLLTEGTFGLVDALLDGDSIRKGLGPRCSVVISKAERPEMNDTCSSATPDAALVEHLAGVLSWVMSMSSPLQVLNTSFEIEAAALHKDFDRETTWLINNSANIIESELWNRSHLKAMKLAALVASGVNHYSPTITADQMNWAINAERYSTNQLLREISSGEVGEVTEDVRLSRVIKACTEYVTERDATKFPHGYRVDHDLHQKMIITFAYLNNKLGNTKPFRRDGHKQPSQIIRDCLKLLVDKGDLEYLPKGRMNGTHDARVEGWMIANLRSFGLQGA
ncbi:hypothetical protein PANO111632_04680 [Paracoccus nototheniae]|uniref:DUF3987 domain-containing protein n=1 Tax=Paracoccus nototheniae TaxID=2489002 RepID=A0ABW4DYU6_9RHOB|nr:hypothetical protein [Paracoccus nototheniae]